MSDDAARATQNSAIPSPAQLFDLTGMVAIVTGASSGLGERFARVLAAAGASVVLVARRAERLDALEQFDRIDVLANNAGLREPGSAVGSPVTSAASGRPAGCGSTRSAPACSRRRALAAIVPHLPDLDLTDVAGARAAGAALMAAAPRPADPALVEEDLTVPGAPPVPVTVHRPRAVDGPLPVVVVVHGGGFALGDRDSSRSLCLQLAAQVPAVVVNVEYRLSPEHPYPAAVDDVVGVLGWVGSGAVPGADPDRMAVHGSSAGAAIAVGAVLRVRDAGGPAVAYQVLVNPVTDDQLDSASMRRFTDTPMWDAGKCAQMWALYLGDVPPDPVPTYAAPARVADLSGLPPAFVLTAELDPLRDEGIAYAHRMLQAGVMVELHNVAGVMHGFGSLPVAVARRWAAVQVEALRTALTGRPEPAPVAS